MGFPPDEKIEKVMTKNPITVNLKTSLASAAHEMVWEGIELLPVVDDYRKIIGVISREDVIKSLHYMQKQPQVGETIQELSFRGFSEEGTNGETVFSGQITPQMTDSLGMLSTGVCTTLMTEAAIRALRRKRRGDLTIQNVTLYFLKPVQIESHVKIQPRILDLGRKQAKMDVEMLLDQQIVAKALITAHAIDR
jgi:predicted transcriptional regulator